MNDRSSRVSYTHFWRTSIHSIWKISTASESGDSNLHERLYCYIQNHPCTSMRYHEVHLIFDNTSIAYYNCDYDNQSITLNRYQYIDTILQYTMEIDETRFDDGWQILKWKYKNIIKRGREVVDYLIDRESGIHSLTFSPSFIHSISVHYWFNMIHRIETIIAWSFLPCLLSSRYPMSSLLNVM